MRIETFKLILKNLNIRYLLKKFPTNKMAKIKNKYFFPINFCVTKKFRKNLLKL